MSDIVCMTRQCVRRFLCVPWRAGWQSVWLGCMDKNENTSSVYCFFSILKFTGILLFQPTVRFNL